MIRRGFWLTAGAVAGIYGYRRVSALGRRLSDRLNPAAPGVSPAQEAMLTQGARLARQGRRGTITAARETFRFTRDVREGMALYTARHSAPAGSTLSTDHTDRTLSTDHTDRTLSTDHESPTYEPKDGH
jgi:hypothetical protein